MSSSSALAQGSHLVGYSLEQRSSNQTQSFRFDCRDTCILSFVVATHSLNGSGVRRVAWRQDLGQTLDGRNAFPDS